MTDSARRRSRQHGRFPIALLSCAALTALLVGCVGGLVGGGGGGRGQLGASASPASPAASPSAARTPSAPLPAPVANAQQQAAADAGVPFERALVLRYERVEFPSAALGCPAPGKGYAQVITPGYSVRLRVGEREVEYHTNLEQAVVRCADTAP